MKRNILILSIVLAFIFLTGCQGAPEATIPVASGEVRDVGGLSGELDGLDDLEEDISTENLQDLDETLGIEF